LRGEAEAISSNSVFWYQQLSPVWTFVATLRLTSCNSNHHPYSFMMQYALINSKTRQTKRHFLFLVCVFANSPF